MFFRLNLNLEFLQNQVDLLDRAIAEAEENRDERTAFKYQQMKKTLEQQLERQGVFFK